MKAKGKKGKDKEEKHPMTREAPNQKTSPQPEDKPPTRRKIN